jgi:hypothetical protein
VPLVFFNKQGRAWESQERLACLPGGWAGGEKEEGATGWPGQGPGTGNFANEEWGLDLISDAIRE